MIILCTHNSGGVGKTTLAIHSAGVLASKQNKKTLLMDCDDQADSWLFYAKQMPKSKESLTVNENLTVLDNQKREKIAIIVDLEEYDNVVIDIDSEFLNTLQAILKNENKIDLVLIPINKSQYRKALNKLSTVLSAIAKIEVKYGFTPSVMIVPLGVQREVILEGLNNITDKPRRCHVANAIRNLEEEMSLAVYEDKKYIWKYPDCEDLYQEFCSLLGIESN